jgi:hypothetical protein
LLGGAIRREEKNGYRRFFERLESLVITSEERYNCSNKASTNYENKKG